jgi:hypothetical protein
MLTLPFSCYFFLNFFVSQVKLENKTWKIDVSPII